MSVAVEFTFGPILPPLKARIRIKPYRRLWKTVRDAQGFIKPERKTFAHKVYKEILVHMRMGHNAKHACNSACKSVDVPMGLAWKVYTTFVRPQIWAGVPVKDIF